jgi:hypothetical protein
MATPKTTLGTHDDAYLLEAAWDVGASSAQASTHSTRLGRSRRTLMATLRC